MTIQIKLKKPNQFERKKKKRNFLQFRNMNLNKQKY